MIRFGKKMPLKKIFIWLIIKNISKQDPDPDPDQNPEKMDRIRNTGIYSRERGKGLCKDRIVVLKVHSFPGTGFCGGIE